MHHFRAATLLLASSRPPQRTHGHAGLDRALTTPFLLVNERGTWTDSDAIMRVLAGLGGFWRPATVLRTMPRSVRDIGYRLIARNRYRWCGRTDHCMLPSP
ncbi:thiol-disulfide oxidoreductase DCC family protein [Xanthomonas arboricola]|uniref:thiol-disulfide oxidoreductase DCC family protein n=1 Tax=Xanthomonas arboricola TaxID=56448 RepID=UPI000CEE925F|nr:DCC1-like thiol-disulfide oxidoreductase family protein [Xanthomonas arboricola]PPU40149.1 hypothetical protein XaplCFBP3123_09595 [Xanthomonas arboricola pv. populi]RYE87911.1 MAG: DUF393 domain-containing protein [Oxalobacteraceae bacterium]